MELGALFALSLLGAVTTVRDKFSSREKLS
jgi:hypothetical protein